MFNFLRSNESNSDQLPKNQVYGRHIDIKAKGYVPPEYVWAEGGQKGLYNNDKIEESQNFGQHKDYLTYGHTTDKGESYTSMLLSPFQSLRRLRRNSGESRSNEPK